MAEERRKTATLSLKMRMEVILEHEKGLSQRALAAKYNCGKTQIYSIIANKEHYKKEWLKNGNINYKRKKRQTFEVVNNLVWDWYQTCRSKGLTITGPMIQEKAKSFANALNVEKFSASNGWLESFKKRHNINFKTSFKKNVDINKNSVIDNVFSIYDLVQEYNPCDIFNVDETNLFFHTFPVSNQLQKNEDKTLQDRVTLLLCVNASGEKELPLVIYTSPLPECLQAIDVSKLGFEWHENKNAWMTSDIFDVWLNNLNIKMQNANRHVLLLLDNAPYHSSDITLSNVKLFFVPYKFHPLHQGIIHAFKVYYLHRLMKALVERMDHSIEMSSLVQTITVADAVSWMSSAWEQIKVATVQKCFKIWCKITDEYDTENEEIDLQHVIDEIQAFAKTIDIELEFNNMEDCSEQLYWEIESMPKLFSETESSHLIQDVRRENGRKCQPTTTTTDKCQIEALSLCDALKTIRALKALANDLGHKRLPGLLTQVEWEFKSIIKKNQCKN